MQKPLIPVILICLTLSGLSGSSPVFAQGTTLDLSAYLQQVGEKHDGIRASRESAEGARMRADEGSLPLSPQAFSTLQYMNDRKEPASPYQGNQTKMWNWVAGVSQQTDKGLQAKLYYNLNHTELNGLTIPFPGAKAYTDSWTLELEQALLRNAGGREIQASRDAGRAQALATGYLEDYRVKLTLAEAESLYWRLTLARDMVEIQKETLKRAEKIKEWSAQRTDLQLADRVDYLQADAAALARKLELKAAEDEERAAARAFNTMRGIDSDVVAEELTALSDKVINALQTPTRRDMRDDVKAAEQQRNATKAAAAIGTEKNTPSLSVFGSIALNGRDPEFGEAFSEAVGPKYPTQIVGLRFSTSLDADTTSRNKAGYAREIEGSELNLQRKKFEQDRQWKDLTTRFADARDRLAIARKFEKAQREKLMHEKKRHTHGRTTIFQVLQFEQDYATTQAARLRIEGELLSIVAQMKTFGG